MAWAFWNHRISLFALLMLRFKCKLSYKNNWKILLLVSLLGLALLAILCLIWLFPMVSFTRLLSFYVLYILISLLCLSKMSVCQALVYFDCFVLSISRLILPYTFHLYTVSLRVCLSFRPFPILQIWANECHQEWISPSSPPLPAGSFHVAPSLISHCPSSALPSFAVHFS